MDFVFLHFSLIVLFLLKRLINLIGPPVTILLDDKKTGSAEDKSPKTEAVTESQGSAAPGTLPNMFDFSAMSGILNVLLLLFIIAFSFCD